MTGTIPYTPNLASFVNGVETNPPTPKNSGDGQSAGAPTTPSASRGILSNTTIDQMNNSLAHACDFAQDIKKSIGLKKYIKSIAQSIRKAIRAIKRFLGLSDNSGLISTIIQKLSAIAKDVRNFIKEYITPIQKFLKDVVGFIKWATATIQWILSLPAKFIQMLSDCLRKVIAAITSVFKDALAEAAAADQAEADAELLAAGGTPPEPEPGIEELIAQAKDTIKAGQEAVNAVTSTVGQAVLVATTATAAVGATAAAVSGASTLSTSAAALVTAPTSLTDTTNATQSVSAIQAANATPAQTQASASSATTPANPKNTV